jgi:hypothetical protein
VITLQNGVRFASHQEQFVSIKWNVYYSCCIIAVDDKGGQDPKFGVRRVCCRYAQSRSDLRHSPTVLLFSSHFLSFPLNSFHSLADSRHNQAAIVNRNFREFCKESGVSFTVALFTLTPLEAVAQLFGESKDNLTLRQKILPQAGATSLWPQMAFELKPGRNATITDSGDVPAEHY